MRTWCSCGEGRGSASNDNDWPTACNRMAAMEVELVRDNPFSRVRKSVAHQVRHFDSKCLTAAAKAASSVCTDSCRGLACAAHRTSSHVRSAAPHVSGIRMQAAVTLALPHDLQAASM